MLLYNVTSIVEDAEADRWLKWTQEEHIPKVMETGKFVSYRLLKVVDSPNEGVTYCVQYVAESMADYNEYLQRFAPVLQAEIFDQFGNQALSFRTLMEYIKPTV
jgi:hypothetical protein